MRALIHQQVLIKSINKIVNNYDKFDINKIDIKASSAAINDKMLEKLKNF